MEITMVFEPTEDGIVLAYIPEISGVNSQGKTIEEAEKNLTDALEMFLVARRELNAEQTKGKKVITQSLVLSS